MRFGRTVLFAVDMEFHESIISHGSTVTSLAIAGSLASSVNRVCFLAGRLCGVDLRVSGNACTIPWETRGYEWRMRDRDVNSLPEPIQTSSRVRAEGKFSFSITALNHWTSQIRISVCKTIEQESLEVITLLWYTAIEREISQYYRLVAFGHRREVHQPNMLIAYVFIQEFKCKKPRSRRPWAENDRVFGVVYEEIFES